MNTEEFVDVIRRVVDKSSVRDVEDNLLDPPGRSPAKDLVEMSNWFKSLSKEDKEMTLRIADYAVHVCVFGFFCVLDGVRAIEGIGEKGDLKLFYEKGDKKVLLNDPHGEFLHDIYNAK